MEVPTLTVSLEGLGDAHIGHALGDSEVLRVEREGLRYPQSCGE